jgi:uncharacterized protein YjiS (DUF1127 family)
MQPILTRLAAEWQRLACRIREARRLRRDLREIAAMNTHELRDIGFTHSTIALAATTGAPSCCR